jgi:hypothetical protein
MSSPLAVVIGDLHFSPQTLELASAALLSAREMALELGVPLVINGDTLDTKVVMRGECVNRLIAILSPAGGPETYVNVGNHDLFNEKSAEHVLNFLRPYVHVVQNSVQVNTKKGRFHIISYMHDSKVLAHYLSEQRKPQILVMHQGVQTAFMGHYVQDKASLPPEAFDGFIVVGSHYHRRQTIKCGKKGRFTYIGNPYTLSFGEAQDGPKGFAILNTDGSLDFVDFPLRKHVVLNREHWDWGPCKEYNNGDLVWAKITGPESELPKFVKKEFAKAVGIGEDFRLDLIPTDSVKPADQDQQDPATGEEMLDGLIDATGETDEQKANLKKIWRNLLETA